MKIWKALRKVTDLPHIRRHSRVGYLKPNSRGDKSSVMIPVVTLPRLLCCKSAYESFTDNRWLPLRDGDCLSLLLSVYRRESAGARRCPAGAIANNV